MVCGITAAKLSLLYRKIFSHKEYKEKDFVPFVGDTSFYV
jgi:hypothetical protein